ASSELEGEWLMVSAVMNGKPMDESMVAWCKRVTQGNQTTVYAGPNIMMQAEFSADASTTPKSIDYINRAGTHKGKAQQGIYGFEGTLLKINMAPPGGARPSEFMSTPRDGRALTVWRRA